MLGSDSNNNLTVRLLAEDHNMKAFDWPQEEACLAKLYIPSDYESYDYSGEAKCFTRFDQEHQVLVLIAEDSQEIIDVIDPMDIVGAGVEIKLLEGADELGSTKPTFQSDNNAKSKSSFNIFQPLEEDSEKIFSGWDHAPLSDISVDAQASAVLTIYAYPRHDPSQPSSSNFCGKGASKRKTPTLPINTDVSKLEHRHAAHRRFEVAASKDFSDITNLVRAIRKQSKVQEDRRRLLVVVNPKSGTEKGRSICNEFVVPVLVQAGIDHDILITTHERHAEERMKQGQEDDSRLDVSEYDGVVVIGGDGAIHEIFQGLYSRSDFKELCSKLKLGAIGAGTGNGLAMSLAHSNEHKCTPLDSIFLVAKGNTSWMDLAKYQTRNSDHLSFLTFSWAIVADLDIESECIRFMGSLRFDIWAVWRVIALRKYRARFSYLPATAQNSKAVISDMPALNDPVPKDWVTSEDDFYLFWASQVTHASENTFHAPPCKLQDGVFQILIVRKNISRFRMAMLLLGLETGTHVNKDGLEIVECVAYRLEPTTPGSFNDLDGEVIESGPIQGHVLPAAIRTYHL
jgi:sphingosine kinase